MNFGAVGKWPLLIGLARVVVRFRDGGSGMGTRPTVPNVGPKGHPGTEVRERHRICARSHNFNLGIAGRLEYTQYKLPNFGYNSP